jgi:hypothetical protein
MVISDILRRLHHKVYTYIIINDNIASILEKLFKGDTCIWHIYVPMLWICLGEMAV